ncbi:S41 family peptidase [Wenzhouxiangella marina]|uniref:Uncharacterized protein n=1 Tax=Wenzhouxiangella marina TaxID=1579979 RepID=A0A0K0XU82_9GAMM|nr:S41 family peptidase [Wenzhouxiangella marina]AKS41233.1 hypothetical protein WM2015_852 [Wenzhouxiangella marina]MBB6088113.1 carboxyl-terminal processing protease [Wenzhouxiangella marina]
MLQTPPSRRHGLRLLLLALTWLGLSACAAPAHEAEPDFEPTALATFDQVWEQVRSNYYDFERIAEDWNRARDTLRPRAAAARDDRELRRVLVELLDRIGASHFAILPGDPAAAILAADPGSDHTPAPTTGPRGDTGLAVRLIGDALVFSEVPDPVPDGLMAGDRLLAIDEQSLDGRLAELQTLESEASRERAALLLEAEVNARIGFPALGEPLRLRVATGDREARVVEVVGRRSDGERVQLGNFPPMFLRFQTRTLPQGESCVGLLRFSTWVPALMERFNEVRDELLACDGLIIDLRGNLGGVLTTMVPLASHLSDEPMLLGRLLRADGQLQFRVFPRRVADDGRRLQPYTGPIAILIDSLSASTSELFTAGMQAAGRARVFGQRSPGMALPAQMMELANGDRLMYAFADYLDGQDRRIEGVGVIPDQAITLDRDALASGSDPVLEAALRWLADAAQPVH